MWRQLRAGEKRAWAALIAVFLLLLQGAIPAAAIAADHDGGERIQICTAQGLKLASPGQPHHKFGGLACEQCVMASLAAVAAAAPVIPAPRAFALGQAPEPASRTSNRPRDPPRPPSRAPPLFA